MFTRAFERSGDAKQTILGLDCALHRRITALMRSNQHIRHLRTAFGDRASLVEHDRIDLLQPLQGFATLDQNSERLPRAQSQPSLRWERPVPSRTDMQSPAP